MSSLKDRIEQLDPAQREALRTLAARGALGRQRNGPALKRSPRGESPLSLPQRRLWLMSQLEGDACAYNIPGAFVLAGPFDQEAFASALHAVAARHEILRTSFHTGADGEPCQRIAAATSVDYQYITRHAAGSVPDAATLEAWAREVVNTPPDLAQGRTWRAVVYQACADLHLLALSFHHIVFDGWSLGLFVREVFDAYAAATQGAPQAAPAPRLQYSDYVEWQAASFDGVARKRETAYWREALAGPLPVLDLPADHPRPATQRFRGALVRHVLPPQLFERIKRCAGEHGATPYAAFLAGYQVLLHRYTHLNDIVVGTPVSGRAVADLEPLIGVFVNTLPIRVRIRPADSFTAILHRVREVSLDAFAHATLPFDEIVEAVNPPRVPGRNPVFQTLFTYQNAITPMHAGAMKVSYLDVDTGSAKFDLSLDVFEGDGGAVCLFEYDTALYERSRIERMAAHFEQLLWSAVEDPDRTLSQLQMLSDDELDLACASVVEPALALPAGDFVSLFEQRVAEDPDACAVRFDGTGTTYGELNRNANRMARQMRGTGVAAGQTVGVCLERGPRLIEAVLATLKLGAAFVALDPSHPPQRLKFVAQDAGVACVLSESRFTDVTTTIGAPPLMLDSLAAERLPLASDNLGEEIAPGHDAYVVYTSGTTGQPKGVRITHRNAVNAYFGWETVYGLADLKAHLQMASFAFDVFCGDLIRALGSGKTLVICPQALLGAPDRLHALIVDEGVDFAEFVPAVFRGLADHLRDNGRRLGELKVLVVASDSWYVSEYRAYLDLLGPNGRLVNSYGMAEATIDSTWFESDAAGLAGLADGALVPIGRPFPNVEVLVLDPALQPLPPGMVGELCIGGLGVAAGYLNRPVLNDEKFVPHPFEAGKSQRLYRSGDLGRLRDDGQFELVGRRDTQVKIRGMRIELGEIEMALRNNVPGITDIAAVLREDEPGERCIVVYVVGDGETALDPPSLNATLASHVPAYMLPSTYVFLEALPLSGNGKVDRNKLPRPGTDGSERLRGFVAPRTLSEEVLATVWCHAFRANRVGVFDSFFELGGHSLLAFQIVARIREVFQVDLPLTALFANPTIAGLAAAISDLQGRRTEYDATVNALPTIVPDPASQHLPFPMTEVQQAYWLGRNDVFEFGNVTTHSYDEMETTRIDRARFERAWNKVVARHPMLRAEILPDGTQHILQQVPNYAIRELDLRGQPAEAVDAAIEQVRSEMSHQMLDVHRWPVFDVRITRLEDDRARIHFSSDALIFDVWSFVIIIEDLVKFYLDEAVELPALDLSFRDYVLAEQSLRGTPRYAKALAYWRQRIASLAPAPDLPMAMDPSLLKKPRFTRLHAELEPKAWDRLKAKAVRAGLTATGLMLAAYAEVLAAYSARPEFSLNLTFLNRHPMHPQVNEIVGEFTSLTMLGVDQTRGASFIERARLVQGDLWNDLEHHDISGVQVLRDLTRVQGGATRAKMPVVFTSALVVPIPKRKEAFPIVPVYRDGVTQTSQVWLDCGVWEDDHVLLCNWDVVLELYPKGLIEEMFQAYWRLVRRLADEDDLWQANELAIAPAKPARVAAAGNLPELPATDETLDSLFLRNLSRRPSAPAVICGDVVMDYETLGEHAAWVARNVEERVVAGELVAVAMDKGWEQVAAVVGVVAAGAAYLPIDPALPDERVATILADGKVRCVLTTPALQQRFAAFAINATDGPAHVLTVDPHSHAPLETLYSRMGPRPEDVAYVIFTSGSTGRPKGVTIQHRGAVNTLLDVIGRFALGANDRVLAVSSLSFDLSVFDVFGMLACGGAIVIPQHERRLDPTHWLALMQRHQVTVWNSVPALCGLLMDHAQDVGTRLPRVRHVMLSGDWISVALPDRVRERCPAARVTSLGGATEASIWSVLYELGEVPSWWKSIPYGTAMRNQTIDVLNDALEPCPDWVTGQICIGGIGLALRYWGDREKTARSFVTHPRTGERLYRTGDLGRRLPDGNIEFLGRSDCQVKVQGHRIELGEIEAVLAQHPAVREAVAVAVGERGGEKRLGAFFVPREAVEPAELRRWLLERLPEYMVPQKLRAIETLPLTANGKVDRNGLPPLFEMTAAQATERVAPRTDAEARVAEVWCEVLGVDGVGAFDDFFGSGGDSMLAIKLLATLRHRLAADIQLKDIFVHPTVAAQAERLQP